jgi:hypothetical protein
MRCKGLEITVSISLPPENGWLWAVELGNARIIQGKAFSRRAAVRLAQVAIDRAKTEVQPRTRKMAGG